jgi:hypothetical protein
MFWRERESVSIFLQEEKRERDRKKVVAALGRFSCYDTPLQLHHRKFPQNRKVYGS